jgi:hypothetical protein
MLDMITKVMTTAMLIAILGFFVYLNDNKSYSEPFKRLTVPLTEDEHQFLPNQLVLHMDNQTNGGAVEVVSNETGQNVTQYFKYNPDRNSVTVSNSTMTADFAIQVPDPNDPNTVKINRINLPLLDVLYIKKYTTNSTGETWTKYNTSYKNIPITIGNSTYNQLEMMVAIPKDKELYNKLLFMYLQP